MNKLFIFFDLFGFLLVNCVVMVLMICMCILENIFSELIVFYYGQCVLVGLIIIEGFFVFDEGCGYLYMFGFYIDEQIEGWCKVIDVVYVNGGKIFVQFWYVGRLLYVLLQLGNVVLVLLGDVLVIIMMVYVWVEFGKEGLVLLSKLCVLIIDEVKCVIQDFVLFVCCVMDVGFDGVELMVVNVFLFDQFLSSKFNICIDQYGGLIENCQCLLLEIIDVVVVEIGGDKVGVCVFLFGCIYDMEVFEGEVEVWVSMVLVLNEWILVFVYLNYQIMILVVGMLVGFGVVF